MAIKDEAGGQKGYVKRVRDYCLPNSQENGESCI